MDSPVSERPRLRLDSPAGPEVYLLGTAGEFYVRVKTVRSGYTFETPRTRLHRQVKP